MFHVYHLHRSSATHNIKLYINSAKIQVHLSTYRKSVFSHMYFRNFEWTRVKRWFPLRIMSDYCKEIQETVMERTYKASSHLINCLILVESYRFLNCGILCLATSTSPRPHTSFMLYLLARCFTYVKYLKF